MPEKKPGEIMVSSGGVMREFVIRLKLIARLMGDSRVNVLLKALPLVSIVYLVFPFDLVSVIPGVAALDDIAIVSLANYLFVELCPPGVVQEHLKSLAGNLDSAPDSNDVVDAEATDVSDKG